jgi:hypothetical protein
LQCWLIKYSGIGAEVTGKALQGAFVAGLIAFDHARPDERNQLHGDLQSRTLPGCLDLMDQWIVEFDGMPFAYAQAYCVHSWPQKHLEHLPADARAIDALIGVPEMLSKGHGGRFLRQLAMMLVEQGAPLVAIDPDADNLRARRAYARAGFKAEAILRAADGPVALMIFRP